MITPENWSIKKESLADYAEMLDHNTAALGSSFEAKVGPLNTKETSYGIQDPTQPINKQVDVGTPQIEEGERVDDSSSLKGINYYLITDRDGNYSVHIPSIGGEYYKSGKKSTRQAALEDAYKILNTQPPRDTISELRNRFPEWTT